MVGILELINSGCMCIYGNLRGCIWYILSRMFIDGVCQSNALFMQVCVYTVWLCVVCVADGHICDLCMRVCKWI